MPNPTNGVNHVSKAKIMFMRYTVAFKIAVFALLALVSCDSDDSPEQAKRQFVPGDVSIGIKATTPIASVFDLMNDNDVFIDQMSGFFYYSALPTDSLDYVINQLKSKTYFNKRGFAGGSAYVHALDNRITVVQSFFEMDADAQQDWLTTIDELQLKDLGNDTRNLLIKVTPGTENFWMNTFKNHPEVTWVDLNWYGDIVLN
jgi:hypothetical protein